MDVEKKKKKTDSPFTIFYLNLYCHWRCTLFNQRSQKQMSSNSELRPIQRYIISHDPFTGKAIVIQAKPSVLLHGSQD